MNLGGLLLQALLEFWPRTRINPMDEEENEVNHGKETLDCRSVDEEMEFKSSRADCEWSVCVLVSKVSFSLS